MKRKLALLMTACILLSACSKLPQQAWPPAGSGQPSASLPNDGSVDTRIKTVGESYDGLYSYDYSLDAVQGSRGFYSKGMTNSVAASAMPEMAAEAADEDYGFMPDIIYEEPDWNTESYNEVKESGIVSVQTQPFSTRQATPI